MGLSTRDGAARTGREGCGGTRRGKSVFSKDRRRRVVGGSVSCGSVVGAFSGGWTKRSWA
jgi:hypothetical protein